VGLHRVESAHQQIEQLIAYRAFVGRRRQRRLIEALSESPQQRVFARKTLPCLGQRQAGGLCRARDGQRRPPGLARQTKCRRDQRVVEIMFAHGG